MSRRTERIASVIRQVVADGIQHRLNDPRIEPLTSITRVEVSADMSVARVNISIMADPGRQRACLRAIQHAGGRLRALVADALTTRTVPALHFHLDESLQRGFQIVQLIDSVMGAPNEHASDEDTDAEPEEDDDQPPDGDSEDSYEQLQPDPERKEP